MTVMSNRKKQSNLREINMETAIKLEERRERDEEFVREYV